MHSKDYNTFLKYLKKENIRINRKEFIIQAVTHPEYPSFLAFNETFDYFNIENYAVNVEIDEIKDLPFHFITILIDKEQEQYLTFVERKDDKYICTRDNSSYILTYNELIDLWTGVVFIVEKSDEFKNNKLHFKASFSSYLFSLIGTFIIGVGWLVNPSLVYFVLSFLTLLGVFLSVEAIKNEFNVESIFSEAVCKILPNFNCKYVLESNIGKLFSKFSLSDLGIIFFLGQFISLFLLNISGYIENSIILLKVSLLLSLPITVLSIYFQWKVIKKWCALCLMIIGILYLELSVCLYKDINSWYFEIIPSLLFVISFLFVLVLLLLLKPIIKEHLTLKSQQIEFIKFKRNYNFFSYALLNSKKVNHEILSSPINIGNQLGKIKIILITDLFCNHCHKAHESLKNVIEKRFNDINLDIRFNLNYSNLDRDSKLLYHNLIQIYQEKGTQGFIQALDYWFDKRDLKKWFDKYLKFELNPEIDYLLEKQVKENIEYNLVYTPTIFIGKYLYPENYKISDFHYFIENLINDKRFWVN